MKTSFSDKIRELYQIGEVFASTGKISPTDLLKKVSDILSGMKFAVAGGFARSIHATPRATGDVDIVVATRTVKEVEKTLLAAGFEHKDILEYQKPKRRILKYTFEGREFDIVEYPDQDFVSFLLQSSVKRSLFNTSYSFLGLEGVILTKLCSFRYKDKADILDLLKANPSLDIIKNWCSSLGIMDRFSFLTDDHEDQE